MFAECCVSVESLCGPGWQRALTFQEKYLLDNLVTSAVMQGRLSSQWIQLAVLQGIMGSNFWPGTSVFKIPAEKQMGSLCWICITSLRYGGCVCRVLSGLVVSLNVCHRYGLKIRIEMY